jgi:dTDP-glucose 4,6-dehydratase
MILPPEDLTHVLTNVTCWQKLRGKRIFLTGASGFVGTWLTETFDWANQALNLGAQLVRVRRDFLPVGPFDMGIHAAKADSFWADMAATRRILDFSVERGVSRLLFTSSGAVYGKLPAEMTHVAEDFAGAPYPHDPATGYAQAKRMNEFLCAEYADQCGFCAILARLFTFSGPLLPLDRNFAIGNFIRNVLAGGPVVIQGDGSAIRSYLYAADLAIWLWTLLLEGENARPYNVGSPEAISVSDLASSVVAHTQPGTPIVINGTEAGVVYVPCVQRARLELNLHPLISLEEGIRRMHAWNLHAKFGEMARLPATTSLAADNSNRQQAGG